MLSAMPTFALFSHLWIQVDLSMTYVCRTIKVDHDNRDAGHTMGKTRRQMPEAGLHRPVLIHKSKQFNHPSTL